MSKKLDVTARVYPAEGQGGSLLAFAHINIGNSFTVNGLRIVEGKNGPFVSMPSKEFDGTYADVAFPITREMREALNESVLAEYRRVLALPAEERVYAQAQPAAAEKPPVVGATVRLTPESKGKRLAEVSVVLDGCFTVKGITVMEGKNGPFVSMPSRIGSDGDYHDIVFPTTAEMRQALNDKVMEKYQAAVERAAAKAEKASEQPAQEAPEQEKPAQEKPAQEKPAQEASAQEKASLSSKIKKAIQETQARNEARMSTPHEQPQQKDPGHEI